MTNPESKRTAFPLSWVTSGRQLLIVGGCLGRLCRLRDALEYDWAHITVCQPDGEPTFCDACTEDPRVTLKVGHPREEDVAQSDLCIECTDDLDLGRQLYQWCKVHKIPLNAMDKLDYCDLYYSSMITRGPLTLSINSGGAAPAVTSRLRLWLEDQIGQGWATASRLLAEIRNELPSGQDRSDLLKNVAHDPTFLELIQKDDQKGMEEFIDHAANRYRT